MKTDAGAKAPGCCLYPNINRYNEERQADRAAQQELEINIDQEDDDLNEEFRSPVQMELFLGLAA
jgi:hypothetical protein